MEGPPQPPETQPPWHVFALELEDFGPQPASFLSRKHCAKNAFVLCVLRDKVSRPGCSNAG